MEQRALRTPSPLLGIAVVQCAVGRGHDCGPAHPRAAQRPTQSEARGHKTSTGR